MSNQFEDIFKQRFNDFEMKPRASLFSDIIAKKKQKRRKVIWIAATIVGFIATGIAIYFNSNFSSSSSELAQTTEEVIEESSVDKKNNNVVEPAEKDAEDQSLLNCYNRGPNIKISLLDVSDIEQLKDKASSNKDTELQSELAQDFEEILAKDQGINTDKARVFVKDEVFEADILKPEYIQEAEKRFELDKEKETKSLDLNEEANEAEPQRASIVAQNKPDEPQKLMKEERIPHSSKWGIDANAGIGISIPLFSNSELSQRSTTESRGFAHQIEVSAWYRINKQLRLNAGLAYANYSYSLNYNEPDLLDISTEEIEIKETIIHPTLGEIVRYRTEVVNDTNLIPGAKYNETNTYKFVTLPIGLEYNFYIGNRWTVSPRARALLAIQTNANGYYVANNTLHQLPNEPNSMLGLNQTDFTLGIAYRMNDKFEAQWLPNTQVSFHKKNGQGVDIRHLGIFNAVGIRYNF